MSKNCRYCGAILGDSAKICTNCGKVISTPKRNTVNNGGQFTALNQGMPPQMNNNNRRQNNYYQNVNGQRNVPQNNPQQRANRGYPVNNQNIQRPKRPSPRPQVSYSEKEFDRRAKQIRPTETPSHSGNKGKSSVAPLLIRIVKIAVVILVLYLAVAGVRIFLVSQSSYDFGLSESITLPAEDYGDAMSNYFDSGHWHCGIFSGVYYTGTKNGDSYELHFSRKDGKQIVSKLIIDGKEKQSDNLMKTDILGMFMAEKAK